MDITVTLHREDLETAIADYLTKNGQSVAGKSMDIDFKAGRGVANVSATVVLTPETDNVKRNSVHVEEEVAEEGNVVSEPEKEKDTSETLDPPFAKAETTTEEKIPGKNNPLFAPVS